MLTRIYYIYLITNLINGKIYVGRTYKDLIKRFKEHFTKSKNKSTEHYLINIAIREYGSEFFKIELIEINETLRENQLRETFWILEYESYNPDIGYNMRIAELKIDGTPSYTEETIEKMKISQQKRKLKPGRKFRGVSYSKKTNRYISNLNTKGQTKDYKKSFKTPEEAAFYYDKLVIWYYGNDAALNFPENRNKYIQENTPENMEKLVKRPRYCILKGVIYHTTNGIFQPSIRWEGKQIHLYCFYNELEAGLYHDKVSYMLFRDITKLNFPEKAKEYLLEEDKTRESWDYFRKKNRPRAHSTTKMLGVVYFKWDNRKKKWLARIVKDGIKYQLGYYLTKEEAGIAFDKKSVELYGDTAKTNFPIENYSDQLNIFNLNNPTSVQSSENCADLKEVY